MHLLALTFPASRAKVVVTISIFMLWGRAGRDFAGMLLLDPSLEEDVTLA